MASRPVFLPSRATDGLVRAIPVEFRWHAGFAVSQKQKSIADLHAAARVAFGVERILEISSKSPESLGVALSAFNLKLSHGDRRVAVEVAFQSSKVFLNGGPFPDLLDASPRDAKGDPRLKHFGRLVAFRSEGTDWPLQPTTAFYDWLYLKALAENPALTEPLAPYHAFTDIEFNPEKSLNCQARSAALWLALQRDEMLDTALSSREAYFKLLSATSAPSAQRALC